MERSGEDIPWGAQVSFEADFPFAIVDEESLPPKVVARYEKLQQAEFHIAHLARHGGDVLREKVLRGGIQDRRTSYLTQANPPCYYGDIAPPRGRSGTKEEPYVAYASQGRAEHR